MSRRASLLTFFVCLAVCLACLVYPIYVIRPFRAQGAGELVHALVVMRFRGLATLLALMATVVALVFYWRAQSGKWRRAGVTLWALFICGIAALSRVNIYELMFHPNDRPVFAGIARTKLDNGEKVIAVKVGTTARAYPIRNISYHHVINDVIDKVGIVATY
jgi:hypothetical protein